MGEEQVRWRSVQSALINIGLSVFLRMLTFVVNAYILRCVTGEVLGVGVRTTLLFDTILFLSREAHRKACLKKPENKEQWKGIVNLVWLSVPSGAVFSLLLGRVWIHHLELPSEVLRAQYLRAVWYFCLSALIALSAEPFYVVGQAHLRVTFRAFADLCFVMLNSLLQCAVVTAWPNMAILYGAYAHVVNSLVYFVLHVAYFHWAIKNQKKDDGEEDERISLDSVMDFFPTFVPFEIDKERRNLCFSFFQQGFLKQLLTEGEKYMFTLFSLMSLSEQGIYDVIANLGSIPARLFFSKMEESAHLYFSHTVARGKGADLSKEKEASRHLHILLKGLVLLGVVVLAFGYSFSHLLLHIYGGELLSSGVGPALMRTHCVYVMFLAVNGISECYAFAAMNTEEISSYNRKLGLMTLLFLGSTWILARLVGPVGFALANIFNFSMRIAHNMWYIRQRHLKSQLKPLKGLMPSKVTLFVLLVAAGICLFSEKQVYNKTVRGSIAHILIGGLAFGVSMLTIILMEDYINLYVKKKIKKD